MRKNVSNITELINVIQIITDKTLKHKYKEKRTTTKSEINEPPQMKDRIRGQNKERKKEAK